MSALLLDDVGLGLLRQLAEASEACRVMEDLKLNHTATATTSELRGYWAHTSHYWVLSQEFVNHLRFIYANRDYWLRLIVSLSPDINIGPEVAKIDTVADIAYIAEKSVEAYQRYID